MEKSADAKTLNYRNSIKEALEKEIDLVISQIEEAKRSETIITEDIQRIEQDLDKKRLKAKENYSHLVASLSRLEKKLEFSQVQFDLAQNESLSVRNKIDHMRIVLASWKNKVKSLEQDIQKFRSQMWAKSKEQTLERNQEKEKLSEIHLAMSKTANERLRFTQKLEAISVLIKKEKQNGTQIRKTINDNIEKLMSKKVENNEIIKVISRLAQNSGNELKSKYNQLFKTRSHNTKLFDLFENIKSHSLVQTESQFVEEFLNCHDETTKLSKYLLEVLAENESLEYANKKFDAALEDSKLSKRFTQNKATRINQDLNENLKKNYARINKDMQHSAVINEQIEKVKNLLKQSIKLKEEFETQEIEYNENEMTVEDYLAQVENLIESLNVFVAYENNESPLKRSLTPFKIRNLTPEFQAKVDIREFLTSRDPFDEFDFEEDKAVLLPEVWKQRAQVWMDNSQRTRTPNPRTS